MKKRILFLYDGQFGYHTDLYMWGKYLDKGKYEVHYLCFDVGLSKVKLDNVYVNYISTSVNKVWNYLLYFYQLKKYLREKKIHLVFHIDSRFSFIIRLLNPFQRMVLDIRTGDLSENSIKMWVKNNQILFASHFYRNVSVISESLRVKINLKQSKTTILPLGGEYQIIPPKSFQSIRLLYVGSLNNRNIHETILGLSEYLNQDDAFRDISYDIVGFGRESIVHQLLKTIESTGLGSKVFFHGRKKQNELLPFFEKCNIGVIYVPQKKVYDCQPSTKLFECVLAGMPVIVTNTFENRQSLKYDSGVITDDNPKSFSTGLAQIIKNRNEFDSQKIKELYLEYSWNHIVKNKLEPYLDRVI